ncbi:hypothetical protein Tco_0460243, partial [Tanacetum coccineum]
VKGPKEWKEMKTFDKVMYPTYRDACYARGLLHDDKEYIDGLMKASEWGMGCHIKWDHGSFIGRRKDCTFSICNSN